MWLWKTIEYNRRKKVLKKKLLLWLDINKDFILFCKKQIKYNMPALKYKHVPQKKVDFIIMSGTYNLAPTNNIKLWENYIIENLNLIGNL